MAEPAPSELLKQLLASHVSVSGWEIHIGIAPDSPDRVIAIADTIGLDPNPKYLLDYPACQIMVRGASSDYINARQEAKTVVDLLLGITSQDVLGDRLVAVNMNGSGPYFIGRDESMRPLFAINFALIVEPQVPTGGSNRVAL